MQSLPFDIILSSSNALDNAIDYNKSLWDNT